VVSVVVRGNMYSRQRYLPFSDGSFRSTAWGNAKLFLSHTAFAMLPVIPLLLLVAVISARID